MLALPAFVGFAVLQGVFGGPCDCKFPGDELPLSLINNFPSSDPGKYNKSQLVKIYGTSCAAWDAISDTPWFSFCPGGSDFSDPDYNWCQQPWCYVDKECPDAVPSSVFAGDVSGTAAFYSYKTCGGAANCYTNVAWNKSYEWPAGCPYDPNGDKTYMAHKSGDCACSFHGQTLSADVYNKYPASEPGKYQNMSLIRYYGTSCMAWDQVPGTPWFSFCPADADWCNQDYNWCQLPWCYVSSSCKTAVASSVFAGADTAVFFSYDTCLDTPDCYTNVAWGNADNAPEACPFDGEKNGYSTAANCPKGWTPDKKDPCECKFQGDRLPSMIVNNFPSSDPGKYSDSKLINVYGTSCAAWDAISDTPWFSFCPGDSDFSDPDYNWCQQPWCYVDKECPDAVPSSVFAGDVSGKAAFYSYKTCGGAANCYTNVAWNKSYEWPAGCPYDPNGDKTYMAHKSGDCACSFHGQTLSADVYNKYPASEPGKYQNMSLIRYYGTSCMAWDQVPGTPWFSFCPADADWCNQDYNWCQLPWCYVSSSCKTAVASSVFAGADTAVFFSYDTCLDTPDCYSGIAWGSLEALQGAPKFCPFDVHDTGIQTAGQCPNGWTKEEALTCGDIKNDYKANECCGNPNSPFILGKAGKQ